ncbi:MAG: hypothetical protein AB1403_16135 [Candidatus Riflebacteria bacterium]
MIKNIFRISICLIIALFFYPIIGLIAEFCNNLPLAAAVSHIAPEFVIGKERLDRIALEARAQEKLYKNHQQAVAGNLKFILPPEADSKDWINAGNQAVATLSRLLLVNPPLPVVESRLLHDAYGKMDNLLVLAVNHKGEEPLRTMAHELTHFFLLWALLPGMPVDCPRWLNEGLAEHVSGMVVGDGEGWCRFAVITRNQVAPLHVISPGFSWENWHVEWPAREATRLLIEESGEAGFRRLVDGLRFARPFLSVYQIVTGKNLQQFETRWLDFLEKNRVLDNLNSEEAFARMKWMAENKSNPEFRPILRQTPANILAGPKKKILADLSRMNEARRRLLAGDAAEAAGWLFPIFSDYPGLKELREEVFQAIRDKSQIGLISAIGSSVGPVLEPPAKYLWLQRLNRWVAAIIALLAGISLVLLYQAFRNLVVPLLSRLYYSNGNTGFAQRWLLIGFVGLLGGWFLRFLIVAMIPYAGLAAITDLNRILLAEALVVILWLALAAQLRRWEKPATDVSPVKSFQADFYWRLGILAAISAIAPLLAADSAGWQLCESPDVQKFFAFLVLTTSSMAFSLVTWWAVRRWQPLSLLGPAVIYAVFRGGLFADPFAFIFALAGGYRIAEFARKRSSLTHSLFADLALTMPGALIFCSWFPAIDPVAGLFAGNGGAVFWWLIPAFILSFWQIDPRKN